MQLLRLPAVIAIVGLKKSTIYANIKDGKFPPPVKLGARAVAWRSQDIADYIAAIPSTATIDDNAGALNRRCDVRPRTRLELSPGRKRHLLIGSLVKSMMAIKQ